MCKTMIRQCLCLSVLFFHEMLGLICLTIAREKTSFPFGIVASSLRYPPIPWTLSEAESLERQLIMLIFAGWLPPDLITSWGYLSLATGIRL